MYNNMAFINKKKKKKKKPVLNTFVEASIEKSS